METDGCSKIAVKTEESVQDDLKCEMYTCVTY